MRASSWVCAAALVAAVPLPLSATMLNQVALQDLNGQGGSDVDYQSNQWVAVKAYNTSYVYNRKAMFLFELASFGGRDLRDQYVHAATCTVYAYDAQCDGWTFRLFGLTQTTDNDDSRWDETLTSQGDVRWPDDYYGAYQYPNTGAGARDLDVQAGPVQDASMSFAGSLVSFIQWGVGRYPGFGMSSTNPDAKVTLLIARDQFDNEISQLHSRQSADTARWPVLALDARFPEISAQVAGGAVTSGATYHFGSFTGLAGTVRRPLALDNLAGEALSSLHVTGMRILGGGAGAFGLSAPGGTAFYLAQGQANTNFALLFDPAGAYGVFGDARLEVTSNDENERTFVIQLRAEHYPPPPAVAITNPVGASTTVSYVVTGYVVRGTATGVVGAMAWTNAAGGGGGFPASNAWSFTTPLAVGPNALAVTGTNVIGQAATATVTIIRETNTPALAVTNPAGWFLAVPNPTGAWAVAGTANGYVTGQIAWSNSLGGAGTFAAAGAWTQAVALAVGVNAITFVGTNADGAAATAAVTLARQPAAWLTPGDVAVVGWLKTGGASVGSAFSVATLADMPAGTVVYFTDNGAFADGRFFGVTPKDADGAESLCALAFRAPVGAGRIIRAPDEDPRWLWVASGRITAAAPESYGWPMLDMPGDQLGAFQSEGDHPLLRPARHLFVLDDTGGFEEPFDVLTGNIPPDVAEGETALTFRGLPVPFFAFDFRRFDGWIQEPPGWRGLFADERNWTNGLTGKLPAGEFLVGDMKFLEWRAAGGRSRLVFTCAYAGQPYVVAARTNLVAGDWLERMNGTLVPGPVTGEWDAAGAALEAVRLEVGAP